GRRGPHPPGQSRRRHRRGPRRDGAAGLRPDGAGGGHRSAAGAGVRDGAGGMTSVPSTTTGAPSAARSETSPADAPGPAPASAPAPASRRRRLRRGLAASWQLYLLAAPALIFFLIFNYVPMYGVQIAFKDFIANKGITGSPWTGFENFERFFGSFYFWRLLRNTLALSLYQMLLFPLPIILALALNELRSRLFKRFSQTLTYAP